MEALMNWKVAGMAGTALLTIALSGAGAVAGANKFSGNISLAVGQTWQDSDFAFGTDDDSFASIGGSGTLNMPIFSNLNLQLGVLGESAFFDESDNRKTGVQFDAHVYTRNDNYAYGLFGGVGTASTVDDESADYYYVGAEAQYYRDAFTFGLNGGYLDSSSTGTRDDEFLTGAWFANAEVRWYATPKVTVTGKLGYLAGEFDRSRFDQETWNWGMKAEYVPEPKEPLSVWIAYDGHSSEFDRIAPGADREKDSHTVRVGVTFKFGVEGSQIEQDRSGPAFNQMDYGAIVVGG